MYFSSNFIEPLKNGCRVFCDRRPPTEHRFRVPSHSHSISIGVGAHQTAKMSALRPPLALHLVVWALCVLQVAFAQTPPVRCVFLASSPGTLHLH